MTTTTAPQVARGGCGRSRTPCPAGCWNANGTIAHDGYRICIPTTPGYSSPDYDDERYACAPGFYSDQNQTYYCLSCYPGSMAPSQASTSCTPCPAGTFAPFFSQDNCLSCDPSGYYSGAGSDRAYQVHGVRYCLPPKGLPPISLSTDQPTTATELWPTRAPTPGHTHTPGHASTPGRTHSPAIIRDRSSMPTMVPTTFRPVPATPPTRGTMTPQDAGRPSRLLTMDPSTSVSMPPTSRGAPSQQKEPTQIPSVANSSHGASVQMSLPALVVASMILFLGVVVWKQRRRLCRLVGHVRAPSKGIHNRTSRTGPTPRPPSPVGETTAVVPSNRRSWEDAVAGQQQSLDEKPHPVNDDDGDDDDDQDDHTTGASTESDGTIIIEFIPYGYRIPQKQPPSHSNKDSEWKPGDTTFDHPPADDNEEDWSVSNASVWSFPTGEYL